jgi:outer membrane protein OmpA-like peptidoglycan-associated protein/tetratricopeptide (TPR) repeat protein
MDLRITFKNISFSLLSVVFTLIATIPAFSQSEGCEEPNKKAQKLFEKAAQVRFKGSQAYGDLVEATKIDENYVDAFFVLADINMQKFKNDPLRYEGEGNKALKYWISAIQACPSFRNFEVSYLLADHYFVRKQYKEAQPLLETYVKNANPAKRNELPKAKERLESINSFLKLMAEPVPFNPIQLKGPGTDDDEYLPMLSPDNRYLFFTRKSEVNDRNSAFGPKIKEQLTQASQMKLDSFSRGIPMPQPFNQGEYQGGNCMSVDNKMMFVTVVQMENIQGRGFANADIYFSEMKEGRWTDLKSIGDNINGRTTWEGQPSISADNKTLYFASARGENNFGGMDIYKVDRKPDGSWSNPINLGENINTSGNDKSPFVHSDSYTLYFASDGHVGVGGFDIFYAKIDKEGNFLKPTNIGYPINTENDEHGFIVSSDGKYGYFSSNMGGKSLDIYTFELYEEARPEEIIFLRGKISSKSPDAAKGMTIELKNTKTNQVTEGVVDESTGEYVAVIAAKDKEPVMMMAKKDGYAFTSQYIDSDKDVIGRPMKMADLEVNPIEEGQTYRINDITFNTDSYLLSQKVMTILDEFIDFLESNPSVKVSIQGHTDSKGDVKRNLELSERRAKAVNDYLIIEGIDPGRLAYKGFGATKPLVSNATEDGRAKNRRTEFVIRSK